MLLVGLASVAAALLILTLAVLPATEQVPLARLDPATAPPTSALAGAGVAAGAAVEKALARRGRLASAAAALEQAGMSISVPDLVLRAALTAVGLGVLGTLAGGALLGLLLAVAVPLGTRLYVRFRTARRRAAFADQLDDSLQLMASSLRAGHSILRAIDAVAQEASAPTAEEFAAIVNQTRMGRDLSDALDDLAARMSSDDFSWVAQAISIQREVGGNLAEVLDAVGHTIRERNAIRRQVKALSAEGKLSAAVLMGLPVGVVAFLSVVNPSYIAGFTESVMGFALLGGAVLLMTVGGLWLRRTVKIRF